MNKTIVKLCKEGKILLDGLLNILKGLVDEVGIPDWEPQAPNSLLRPRQCHFGVLRLQVGEKLRLLSCCMIRGDVNG